MNNVVTIKHDYVWRPLEWALDHCPSYVTNTISGKIVLEDNYVVHYVDYYFDDPQDATLFALMWS